MKDNQRLPDLSENLLSYLRSELADQQLTYMSLPTPVTGGFDTRIFRFQLKGAPNQVSCPLILRLFKKASQNRATFESAVQNAVADSGYLAPRVFFTCTDESVLSGSFMIMELMPGQTMMTGEPIRRINIPLKIMPVMLAKAHLDMHRIDSDSVRNSLDSAGIHQDRYSFDDRFDWLVKQIETPRFERLQSGLQWIIENRPEDPDRLVICHGDFHPINILTKDGEVSGVLDWSGFLLSDPTYDVGITKFLGEIVFNSFFEEFTNLYYDYYQSVSPVDSDRVDYYESFRCLWALLEGVEGHSGWSQPEIMVSLSERFEKITSVRLALPKAFM
ncbi:MAG: aminoglycoside phosphotransferase family protein [Candidatus Bathyarchaeota archaeon]|nr:aminoglycoside phosphotransferase family protein [Candidatus Bathyarchaeota archaeon]